MEEQRSMLRLVLVLLCLSAAHSQLFRRGACPRVAPAKDFNLKEYMGKWYLIEGYYSFIATGSRCVSTLYERLNKPGMFKITSKSLNLFGRVSTLEGNAVETNLGGKVGKYTASFTYDPIPDPLGSSTRTYWIIETDYDNFSIVWSCVDLYVINLQHLQILGRNATLPGDVSDYTRRKIREVGLNSERLKPVSQEDCPSH